jgi:PAS domain S-box-containing protein
MKSSSKSVRSTFFVGQIISLLVISTILSGLYLINRNQGLRSEQEEHHQVFAMMTQAIASYLEHEEEYIGSLLSYVAYSDTVAMEINRRLPGLLAVYSVTPNCQVDRVLWCPDRQQPFIGADLSGTPLASYIRNGISGHDSAVTSVYTSLLTGRQVVTYIYPYHGQLLLVEQDFVQLTKVIEKSGMQGAFGNNIIILTKQDSNQILYKSSHETMPYWEIPVDTEPTIRIGGKLYFYDTQSLSTMGLRILVLTPYSYYQSFIYSTFVLFVLIFAVFVGMLGVANYWVNKALLNPLANFEEGIRRGLDRSGETTITPVGLGTDLHEWQSIEQSYNELVSNISEQMRVNRELSESLRVLMDSVPDAILITEIDDRILFTNATTETMLGQTEKDLRGTLIGNLVQLEGVHDFRQNYETRTVSSDGDGFYVLVRCRIVTYESRPMKLYLVTDIRQRKAAEAALRMSEERLSALLGHTPNVAVEMFNEEGKILFWNPAATRMFGFQADEAVGKLIDEIMPNTDSANRFHRIIKTITLTGQAYGPVEWRFTDHQGTSRAVLFTMFRLPGDEPLFASMDVDITDRIEMEDALRVSEKRLRDVIDSSPFGAHLFELQGDELVFTGYNRSAEEILRLNHSEWVGKTIQTAFPSSTDTEIRELYRSIARNGGNYHRDSVEYDDGNIHRVFDIHAFNTGPDKLCAFFMDVTERRRAEEQLAQVRAIMDGAFSNSTMGLMIFEVPGYRMLEINAFGCETLGVGREWIGHPLSELYQVVKLIPYDDRNVSFTESPVDRIAVKGETYRGELMKLRRDDGAERWVMVNGAPIRDARGNIVAGVIGFPDITELREAETALAQEKETLSVTLRSIGDGVIATDTEGRVTMLNREAETMTGWDTPEACGKPLTEVFRIISERNRQPAKNPVEIVLRTGQIEGLANGTILIAKDGTERMIADSAAPIRDRDSNIRGIVLVFQDVTGKYLMEREIQKAQKLESVGVLAGGIAHDFNNILMAILGNLSMVKYLTTKNERVSQMLNDAEKACLRARGLTQQLLTFAKGGNPVREATALPNLIRESADFVLTGSNVTCEYAFEASLPLVSLDAGQVSQVIQNLVLNAKQAMPEGGRIEIDTITTELEPKNRYQLPEGQYLRITVRDYGTGIAPENLPRIFDPYYSTKDTGSGLGLSVSYSVIKKHDGIITVESEMGKGSVFTILIPVADAESRPLSENTDEFITGEGRILLMEDEPTVQAVASRMMERFGYQVILASDGIEALGMYQRAMNSESPFDLVILDLTIRGGMGGRETMERLLELDPKVKVIVSSGYSNDPIMANPGQYGFLGMIPKPYKMMDMSRVIHAVLYPKKED